jgi:hypothetical protein
VDAADFVIWRKTDNTPGGYAAWRMNFGRSVTFGRGAGGNAAVPEPSAALLLAMGAALFAARRPKYSVSGGTP